MSTVPPEVREGTRFPGSGVVGSHGCWELNLGSLEEQQMLLTSNPYSPKKILEAPNVLVYKISIQIKHLLRINHKKSYF